MKQKLFLVLGIAFLFLVPVVLAAPWYVAGWGMCAGSDCNSTGSGSSPSYLVSLDVQDEQGNPQMVNVTTFKTDTGNQINTYSVFGNISFPLNDQKIDMDFNYDESNLYMRLQNVSVPDLNATHSRIIVNDEVVANFTNDPNVHFLRGYKVELPSNFHTSKIILKIKYSDLTVMNENNLVLYRCENYDFTSDKCNGDWTPVTISIDTNQKLVSADINSFSVYGLGENESNSTVTTTTTTTVPATTTTTSQSQSSSSSSSSSSSGSGSYYPDTTTTTVPTTTTIIRSAKVPTTTTTNKSTTTTQTGSNYFTGMSASLMSNSHAITASIVAAAVVMAGWIFLKKRPGSLYSRPFRPAKHQAKGRKKHSSRETTLTFN